MVAIGRVLPTLALFAASIAMLAAFHISALTGGMAELTEVATDDAAAGITLETNAGDTFAVYMCGPEDWEPPEAASAEGEAVVQYLSGGGMDMRLEMTDADGTGRVSTIAASGPHPFTQSPGGPDDGTTEKDGTADAQPQLKCYSSGALTTEKALTIKAYPALQPNISGVRAIAGSAPTPGAIHTFLILLYIILMFAACILAIRRFELRMPSFGKHPSVISILSFLAVNILAFAMQWAFMENIDAEQASIFPSLRYVTRLYIGNFVSYAAIAATIYAAYVVGMRKNEGNGFKPIAEADAKTAKALPTILLGIVCALVGASFVALEPAHDLSPLMMASEFSPIIYTSAFFAILAGIYEEAIFRGVIQTGFMALPDSSHPIIRNAAAVAITTILFVALHVPQSVGHLWALAPITIVSIVAGILRIRSGTIFKPMMLHMTYNTVLVLPGLIFGPTTLV